MSEAALGFAENIRLIVWDLDETFWDGTLTEGGITYRDDYHQLVIDLAHRGIMSAICSKNEFGQIETLLKDKGLWDYFIFPSIDWTPKGPRIRAMLDVIGLRPPSTLFLDDNPMNLQQALHENPGLNIAGPDIIATLRDAPELQGKDDSGLTRLAQYKVTERKTEAAEVTGGDTIAFLRRSNVQVYLDYDVEQHIGRAVELVNRTNQLNFTKNRLPEDPAAAAAELIKRLRHNTSDAALIRVKDDFGDYGFVGFYLTRRVNNTRRLEHFCFSCRTLNMYIEHWVYDFLGRPALTVVGEVLSDVKSGDITVDWITPGNIEEMETDHPAPVQRFDRIFARGGCDLGSLMHYFSLHSDVITEEFSVPKNGQMLRRDHSAFLMPALEGGLSPAQQDAAAKLGYEPEDFTTDLQGGTGGKELYFLSFWADADIPLYRHRKTGLRVPHWLVGGQNHDLIARDDLRNDLAKTPQQQAWLEVLCAEFEHEGVLSQDEMEVRYARVLDALPTGAHAVLTLANERGPVHYRNPKAKPHPFHQQLNTVLRTLAQSRPNVLLLDPADEISGLEDMIDLNHFTRDVYHRLYRRLLEQL